MNKTIFKFSFKESFPTDEIIQMQKGAKILKARYNQNSSTIEIWAAVDPEAELEDVHIWMFGTGHHIHKLDELQYIDTVFMDLLGLVFHLFKVVP